MGRVSLRFRTGLAVGVVLAGLVVTLSVIVWAVSVRSVSEVELHEGGKDLARVQNSLQTSLSSLKTFATDWATWDDTYDFVTTKSADYAEENLGAHTFETFDLDALLLTDLEAAPAYAYKYDPSSQAAVPLDAPTLTALATFPELFGPTGSAAGRALYLVLPAGPAQVVSAPVVREVGGAVGGTLLALRYLDADFVRRLEADTLVEVAFLWGEVSPQAPVRAPAGTAAGTTVEAVASGVVAAEVVVAEVVAAEVVAAETPTFAAPRVEVTADAVQLQAALPVAAGSDPIYVAVDHARSLYRHGVRGASALTSLLVTVSLLFGLLTFVFVERLLLSRLSRLSRWVDQTTRSGDLSGRVEVVGVDEIAQLGGNINSLLETLQTSFRNLAQSEERYGLVAAGVNDGLWDWNLATGEVLYSARWFSLLGCDRGETVAGVEIWQERVHPDDRARVQAKLEKHLSGTSEFFEDEHRLRAENGDYLWMLVRGKSVCAAGGLPERMAGSLTNLSTRGIFDPLTGLPNRLMLQRRLGRLFGDRRFGKAGLLFMDVNRFKFINDTLGHKTGDLLLTEIAARLQSCVRADDLVARLGGDEFVVLLETPHTEVAAVVERVEARMAERFELAGEDLFTSLSIGVVENILSCGDSDTALERADAAMYEAKRSGVPHLYYDDHMLAAAVATHRLETDLRRALDGGEFYLHYQPIVALESGRITGVEALLRWQHPERGSVSPAEFVPVAEDAGLIGRLGLWVLEEACKTLAAHPELGGTFSVSVNLSGKQLAQPELLDDVTDILLKTGLNPRQLRLEITETAAIQNTVSVLNPLQALRALGVKIALDDFGTGYSSLTYIQNLPLDLLKVDRSFIHKMSQDRRTLEIVGTTVSLARTLGLELVAEGVETRAELDLLRGLNCPYGQGYLFAKPTIMHEIVLLTLAEGVSASDDPAKEVAP